MGGLDHPYHQERMTDGGIWSGRTRPWKEKKLIFGRQCRVEEDQSSRTFPSTKTAPLVTDLQLPPSHPYVERVTTRLEKEGGVGKFRSRF
jgi:hypothetical protein